MHCGPVLDVGGGRGTLSFELENLNGLQCVVAGAYTRPHFSST